MDEHAPRGVDIPHPDQKWRLEAHARPWSLSGGFSFALASEGRYSSAMAFVAMASRLGMCASLLASVGLPACDDGRDSGDQYDEGSTNDRECEDTVMVLASLAEVSAGGVAGQELVDAASNLGTRILTWTDTDAVGDGFVVVTNATPGPVDLTLGAVYDGGEIRYVASERAPGDGSEEPAIYIECPDRLEVDVTLGFSTSDGLFAEQFQTRLVHRFYEQGDPAGSGPRVYVDDRLDMDTLAGDLEVAEMQPDAPETLVHTFSASFPLGPDSMSPPKGSVGSQGTWSYPNGIESAAFFTMASW